MALSALAGVPVKSLADGRPKRERRNDLGDRVASAFGMSSWDSLHAETDNEHDAVQISHSSDKYRNGKGRVITVWVTCVTSPCTASMAHMVCVIVTPCDPALTHQTIHKRDTNVVMQHKKPMLQAELCIVQEAFAFTAEAGLTCHSAACVENCCYAHALLKG